MSWSIDVTGKKSGVAKKVTEQLDAIAASYEGTEEAKDVLVAKERILAIVAAVDLEDSSPTAPNAIQVKATGAHNVSEKGIVDARMALSVMRTHLALDD